MQICLRENVIDKLYLIKIIIMFLSSNRIKLFFSVRNKFYDVICIGHTAQKVSRLVEQQNKKISYKKLFINSSDVHFQASLSILGKSEIIKQSINRKNVDRRLRNEIQRIDANKNVLILKSGQEIKFKHLIYSGEDHEWKDLDCVKGLRWAVESRYGCTFCDLRGSKVEQLYTKLGSDIYFSICSQHHFGVDNYFMIHLMEQLRNMNKLQGFDPSNTKITVLNKGDKLVPYNLELDKLVKELLNENGIEIVNNAQVEQINHRTRQFTLNTKGKQQKINYGGFYQYLPFKVPTLLSESQINPLNVDPTTLLNKQFPTIHIIGNILPTVFSFYAVNYMSHVIAKNIINMDLKSNSLAMYEGDTVFPFWTGSNSLRYFKMNYEKTKFLNNIGQNKFAGILLGLDRKLMGKRQVSSYYNTKSYGMPFYITSPKLQQLNKSADTNHVQDKKPLSV